MRTFRFLSLAAAALLASGAAHGQINAATQLKGVLPPANGGFTPGFYQGIYSAGTTYTISQKVSYGTEFWESKVNGNVGNTPVAGAFWADAGPISSATASAAGSNSGAVQLRGAMSAFAADAGISANTTEHALHAAGPRIDIESTLFLTGWTVGSTTQAACASAADPTGALDSTCPIQSAVAYGKALIANGSIPPTLYVPHGTFKVSGTGYTGIIDFAASNMKLEGDGPVQSILQSSSLTAPLVSWEGSFGCGISNIQISGSVAGYSGDGIALLNSSGCVGDNVFLNNVGGNGLNLQGSSERFHGKNFKIQGVRRPVLSNGDTNESYFEDFDILFSGETGGYNFSVNAVNGAIPTASAFVPDSRAEAYIDGDNVHWQNGSIKGSDLLPIRTSIIGGSIDRIYTEADDSGTVTSLAGSIEVGGKLELGHLTANITATALTIPVDDAPWQPCYWADPSVTTKICGSYTAASIIYPPDYLYKSTAASVVSGLLRGQYEVITVGHFAGDGAAHVIARSTATNLAGSSGTAGSIAPFAWPTGSVISQPANSGYGTVAIRNNHFNGTHIGTQGSPTISDTALLPYIAFKPNASTPGTGYAVGNMLSFTGGTATVAAVNGSGTPTLLTTLTSTTYALATGLTTTGGAGTGAKVDAVYGWQGNPSLLAKEGYLGYVPDGYTIQFPTGGFNAPGQIVEMSGNTIFYGLTGGSYTAEQIGQGHFEVNNASVTLLEDAPVTAMQSEATAFSQYYNNSAFAAHYYDFQPGAQIQLKSPYASINLGSGAGNTSSIFSFADYKILDTGGGTSLSRQVITAKDSCTYSGQISATNAQPTFRQCFGQSGITLAHWNTGTSAWVVDVGNNSSGPIGGASGGGPSSTIAGLISSGANTALTGSGTASSPYQIALGTSAQIVAALNTNPMATLSPALFPTLNQSTTGNAATATALAVNGTDCPSGQFAAGVDASGNATGCAVPPPPTSTGTVTNVSGQTANGLAVTTTSPTTAAVISVAPDSSHIIPVNTGSTSYYLNQAGGYGVPISGVTTAPLGRNVTTDFSGNNLVADCSTDNSANFQAIVSTITTSGSAIGSPQLNFPAGCYVFKSMVTITSKAITIVGEGNPGNGVLSSNQGGSTNIEGNPSSRMEAIWKFAPASADTGSFNAGAHISNLYFTDITCSTCNYVMSGLEMHNLENFDVENVSFTNITGNQYSVGTASFTNAVQYLTGVSGTAGSTTLTVSSTSGILVGAPIADATGCSANNCNLADNGYVTAIPDSTHVTMSIAAQNTFSSDPVNFNSANVITAGGGANWTGMSPGMISYKGMLYPLAFCGATFCTMPGQWGGGASTSASGGGTSGYTINQGGIGLWLASGNPSIGTVSTSSPAYPFSQYNNMRNISGHNTRYFIYQDAGTTSQVDSHEGNSRNWVDGGWANCGLKDSVWLVGSYFTDTTKVGPGTRENNCSINVYLWGSHSNTFYNLNAENSGSLTALTQTGSTTCPAGTGSATCTHNAVLIGGDTSSEADNNAFYGTYVNNTNDAVYIMPQAGVAPSQIANGANCTGSVAIGSGPCPPRKTVVRDIQFATIATTSSTTTPIQGLLDGGSLSVGQGTVAESLSCRQRGHITDCIGTSTPVGSVACGSTTANWPGSTYTNTSGGSGSTGYACEGTAWVAIY